MKFTVCAVLVFAISLAGCSPSADKAPATSDSSANSPAAADVPIPAGPVPTSYIDASDALYASDFEKAKASLTALASETTGELQARAQRAAEASDLSSLRKEFRNVSDIAARMEMPPDHAAASCPMYQPGSKSLWVQKKGALANPYYGKTDGMATCGGFLN
jgi:hypothetical protein